MSDSRAEEFIKRHETLKSKRGVWETHWQEIADFMEPWRVDFTRKMTPGEKRGQLILDGTATLAADNLAAGIWGTMTNSAQKWFTLRHEIEQLNQDQQVKLWLESTETKLRNLFAADGQVFYNRMAEFNMNLCLYGTGIFYIEELPGGGVFFSNRSLSECVIDQNAKEEVDLCIRQFPWTARQAYQKWGDAVSEDIKKALKKEPDREFEFLHVALPREDYLPNRLDAKGKPYASFYVEKEKRHMLSESGYHFFPYTVGRWTTIPGTPYGVGPGQKALPDTKMLQAMSRTALTAAEYASLPIFLASDEDGFRGQKTRPGMTIFGGMANGQKQYDILQTGANHGLTEEMMQQRREMIKEAFHASLLLMVDRNNMTATEVMQREQEKMRLLGPHMGRHMSEVDDPIIDKTFDILTRATDQYGQPILDQPPEILLDYPNFKVDYVSPMARAQRASEAMAIQKTIAEVGALIQVKPGILDNINEDEVIRALAEINGAPTKMLRDPKEVAATREQQAQQIAAQQAAAAMPAMAGAGKDMAMAEKASAEAAAA